MSTRYISASIEGLAVAGEKKASGLDDNMFTGYAVIWGGETDYNGFKVDRDALTASLNRWRESGLPLPLLYNHNQEDPAYNIGEVVEWVVDERGLKVTCRVDVEGSRVASQVWRLLKARRVKEMSFFGVIEESYDMADGTEVLTRVDIREVSVVFFGANKRALIEYVKNSVDVLQRERDVETVREMKRILDDVLERVDTDTNDTATDTNDTATDTTSVSDSETEEKNDTLDTDVQANAVTQATDDSKTAPASHVKTIDNIIYRYLKG